MAAQTPSMITPPFVYTPPARSRTSSPVASTGFIPLSPPTPGGSNARSNTTSPVNCPSTPPAVNGVRVYEQNFLLQFQNQEPNEHIRSIFQAKHPCLRVFKGCKFADRCFFRDLPQEWCVLCLLGEEHDKCKGTKPDTHPCMRVWGTCKYEDKCVFRPFPRVWCLFCLRGASHTKCSGIQPKKMPIIPKEVTSQCAEHERRVGGRPGSSTPPPRTPDREKERDRTRTPPPRGGFNGLPLGSASLGVSPMASPIPSPSHSNCPSPLPLDAFAVLRTIQEVAPMLPSPSAQPAELPNRADAPFVLGKTDNLDTIQRCARKVKGVLNKLTPEKYSRLMDQLLELLTEYVVTENLEGMMDALASEVFEKATTELMHVPLYARLSRELEGRLSGLPEPHVWGRDGARKYRVALLKRCHGLFYAAIPEEEGERERRRSRSCANTRFVGELYNCQAIPDRIIEEIANNLLWADSDRPLGPRLELLISLIETCGYSFQERNGQRPDRQRVLITWFEKLSQLKATVEPRIQFMIDNVVDLRKNGWTSAHKEVPKTLAEAEQDYYQSVINNSKVRTRSPVLRRVAPFSPPRSPEVSPRMMSAA